MFRNHNITMSSPNEVQEYFDFILPLVQECSQLFLEAKNINIEIENKTTFDIVTKYDKDIEDTLMSKIKAKYPHHKFIGEEESESRTTKSILTNDPTWIIDPIDGTTNFSKKLPLCGISVGLTINKEQALGIVCIPYLGELYTAIKDKGAYLNGKKIKCSNVEEPKKSLFCYEIAVASKNAYLHNVIMTRLSHLVKEVLAVRCLGCPILSLCYVASGRLDAYQCDGLYPWDAAAGTLIVREAGGYVIDSSGGEFDLMDPNFLATSTETLGKKCLDILKGADKERVKGDSKRDNQNTINV